MGRPRKGSGSLPWHNELADAGHKGRVRRLARPWSDRECRAAITSLLEVLGRRRLAAEAGERREAA